MIRIFFLFLSMSGFLTLNSEAADRYHLPEDESQWLSRVYFLAAKGYGHEELALLVEDINEGRRWMVPITALRQAPAKSAGFLMEPVEQAESWGAESARAKLGRYVVVELEETADVRALVLSLASDPSIEHVGVDTVMTSSSTLDCAGTSSPSVRMLSFNKTWGLQRTRIPQAWNFARGHSYIGVADLGIDPSHNEFRDFSGTSYLGGNFHPHLAVDTGQRFWTGGTGGNPYQFAAVFGEVDEYDYKVVTGPFPVQDPDCDTTHPLFPWRNNDGYNQARIAGHGTHVAGIIGARGANAHGWHGVCRHCPLSIMRASHASSCVTMSSGSQQPHTGQLIEANVGLSHVSAMAAIAVAVDLGVQIANYSGGTSTKGPTFCSSNPNDPGCLVIKYAEDRDVMVFAAAGNQATNQLHWPAGDSRVYGISGIESTGAFWHSATNCGSNYAATPNPNIGPAFAAPAKGVYSTMYPDMNYNPNNCHEYNDGVQGDGYGFCIGTSMSAPFLSGIAGIARSVNPLATRTHVHYVLRTTTDRALAGQGYHSQFGYGVPRADDAVKRMLGVSNQQQVRNRVTPLFNMYSSVAGDFMNTTKPQVALAFRNNSTRQYTSYSSSAVVSGYSFKESPANPSPPVPRADTHILTTHVSPFAGHTLRPLYRVRFTEPWGGNPHNWDTTLALQSQLGGFKAVGYKLEGMEGYVYTPCSPEPSCMPPGAVKLYRAYKASEDNHAVFPEHRLSAMQSLGFTQGLTLLGYAYRNIDSDGDGLINGMEYILGTNPFATDSNCNGVSDGVAYPPFGWPVADPLWPGSC